MAYPIPLHNLSRLLKLRRDDISYNPYNILLSSSISLTEKVFLSAIGSSDWDAFNRALQSLGITDRYVFLREHLAQEDLREGYRALAELIKAGYFQTVLTANLDSSLENALVECGVKPSQYRVLVIGRDKEDRISDALTRPELGIRIVKLRGDLEERVIPASTADFFQFSYKIETALKQYLNQDIIIVGSTIRDDDINRAISGRGGAIWYVIPQAPQSSEDYIRRTIEVRKQGQIIDGKYGHFRDFFVALYKLLQEEQLPEPETPLSTSRVSSLTPSKLVEHPITPRIEISPPTQESKTKEEQPSAEPSPVSREIIHVVTTVIGISGLLFGIALFVNATPSLAPEFILPLLVVLAAIILGAMGILKPEQIESLLYLALSHKGGENSSSRNNASGGTFAAEDDSTSESS